MTAVRWTRRSRCSHSYLCYMAAYSPVAYLGVEPFVQVHSSSTSQSPPMNSSLTSYAHQCTIKGWNSPRARSNSVTTVRHGESVGVVSRCGLARAYRLSLRRGVAADLVEDRTQRRSRGYRLEVAFSSGGLLLRPGGSQFRSGEWDDISGSSATIVQTVKRLLGDRHFPETTAGRNKLAPNAASSALVNNHSLSFIRVWRSSGEHGARICSLRKRQAMQYAFVKIFRMWWLHLTTSRRSGFTIC